MQRKNLISLAAMILLVLPANAASAAEQKKRERAYQQQVAPLLNKYCVDCHGPQKQKNDLRVDELDRDFVGGRDAETWHDILDALNTGERQRPSPGFRSPRGEKKARGACMRIVLRPLGFNPRLSLDCGYQFSQNTANASLYHPTRGLNNERRVR